MSVGALVSLEEYLNTSYDPDMEYVDGVLVERNVGDCGDLHEVRGDAIATTSASNTVPLELTRNEIFHE